MVILRVADGEHANIFMGCWIISLLPSHLETQEGTQLVSVVFFIDSLLNIVLMLVMTQNIYDFIQCIYLVICLLLLVLYLFFVIIFEGFGSLRTLWYLIFPLGY